MSRSRAEGAQAAEPAVASTKSELPFALPLPVVEFERYMLLDDRASHPMTFTIRFTFSGRFDETAFRAALPLAVARHALLSARIQSLGKRDLQWVASPAPAPYLDLNQAGVPMRFPTAEQIDLGQETGLRIWVRHASDRAEMRFQFHHSCCDGVGAYRFLEDLLCAYDAQTRGNTNLAAWRTLSPARLKDRTRFGLSRWKTLLRLPQETWGVVAGLSTFLLGRPVDLATPRLPEPTSDELLTLSDYPAHSLDATESRQLRDAAKAEGATFNDLLLRDMLLAFQTWNIRHEPRLARRSLRIMVPTNLRGPGDEELPACNVVAMAFVDRRVAWFRSPRWLLWTIKAEMGIIKTFRLSLAFVRCIALARKIPGMMRQLTTGKRCRATSVLSNLGRLYDEVQLPRHEGKIVTGELTLETIESAPPVRPKTSTSFSTLSYAGRLTLIMNYDRRHFSAPAARELLQTIVAQLQLTAREAGSSTERPT